MLGIDQAPNGLALALELYVMSSEYFPKHVPSIQYLGNGLTAHSENCNPRCIENTSLEKTLLEHIIQLESLLLYCNMMWGLKQIYQCFKWKKYEGRFSLQLVLFITAHFAVYSWGGFIVLLSKLTQFL